MLVTVNRRSITVFFQTSHSHRKRACLREAHIGSLQKLGLIRCTEILQELNKRNRLVAELFCGARWIAKRVKTIPTQ